MAAVRSTFALLLAAFLLLTPSWAAKPPGGEATDVAAEAETVLAGGERILSYASDITVNADASLDVVETIRVRAEGMRINHGIYRDFPTRYERAGRTIRVGFDVQGVTRDGQSEPYATERIDNGVRVRIGDANIIVPPGEHTYVLRYRTTRQLGFFDSYDELYWNVTGNGWIFPIDRVQARIRLPQAVQFGNRAIYTGAQGSTATNGEVASEQPGDISFRSTAGLGSYEGFTIAVAWPKRVVQAPPPTASEQWLSEDGPLGAAIAALAGLCWFFYYAWKRAGRGPIPGTVVPLFEPPEGMSAAEVRYVKRMGFDNRCFAAAIVESGVRGKVRLVEGEKGWFSGSKMSIERTGDPADMPTAERGMLNALFVGGDSIEMDRANHATFRAAQSALQSDYDARHKGNLFLANLHWSIVGFMLLPAAMLAIGAAIVAVDPYARRSDSLIPLFGVGLVLLAIWLVYKARQVATSGWKWLFGAGAAAVLVAAGFVLMMTFALLEGVDGMGWMFAPLLALPLVISAFWWMGAPTKRGRAVMDRIAGFEQYLSITEEERFEALHPPEKTPELFERYLPYAIALDVENSWASRFAGVLAAAAADPSRQGGHISWYSGSSSPWTNVNGFTAAVGATLASSVASASTAPGSSSGSGGGGFSGGGGGGGGGGGW
ncbi:DUF2207 domain-containing protein [Sphingosinicella sp.]|uniref:DUF2207 domain-containing protein n=1 Tax=Sphingosinicella sp. TaxID=1917971 RepID=UPI0040377684